MNRIPKKKKNILVKKIKRFFKNILALILSAIIVYFSISYIVKSQVWPSHWNPIPDSWMDLISANYELVSDGMSDFDIQDIFKKDQVKRPN